MTLLEHLREYAGRKTARFHMPGHKGVLPPPFDGAADIDLTELDGVGDLYNERDGAIRRSERGMAGLYGAADCFYLTGGATQGVFAMLSYAAAPGGTVYAGRNCHKSVINAMALLDLRPVWFFGAPPERGGVVIYTSPDYYGKRTPRPKNGTALCDAAHGAHLPFVSGEYAPPGSLWVVSAHKTLGALGQTAMLMSDGTADAVLLREQTAVFGTASPSFALLASLDAAREALARNGRTDWARVEAFARGLAGRDGRIFLDDPAKLTVRTGDGAGDAKRLEKEFGVVCETADRDNMVFMLSPHNTDEDFARLETALAALPRRDGADGGYVGGAGAVVYELPEPVMTPREAFFVPCERVALNDAAGRTAARAFAPSPPGIPFFMPGERIDKKTLDIIFDLCYTKDEPIWVVRE